MTRCSLLVFVAHKNAGWTASGLDTLPLLTPLPIWLKSRASPLLYIIKLGARCVGEPLGHFIPMGAGEGRDTVQ